MAENFEIIPCWQNVPDDLRARVLEFWQAQNVLGEVDVAPRLAALCAVAEADGEIIATATSPIFYWDETQVNYFLFRCFVAPAWRQKGVATKLFNAAYQHLHQWADANPDKKVDAMMAAPAGAAQLAGKLSEKVWSNTGLRLTGFTPQGGPLYVRWFLQNFPELELPDTIEIRNIWKNVTPEDTAAIIDMWERNGALPKAIDPTERAAQTVLAAYDGDKVIGVYSAGEGTVPRLNANVLFARTFVDPEYRRHLLGAHFNKRALEILRDWVLAHPEEGVEGLAMVIQFNFVAGRVNLRPMTEHTTFSIGKTDKGHDLRMNWIVEGDAPSGAGQ